MIKIESNSKNGLTKNSSADCFQVRSVSKDRFVKRLGELSDSIMDEIRIGLSKVLSMAGFVRFFGVCLPLVPWCRLKRLHTATNTPFTVYR